MPPSCSGAVGLKASALQQVPPIVQRVRVDVYFGDGKGEMLNRLFRSLLKVYDAVLFYMPSFTPLAWHRRTLRSEGCNGNVKPIVRSFTFCVSPLPPLSLFNMVMETVRDHFKFGQIIIKYFGACARARARAPLQRPRVLGVGQQAPRIPEQQRFQITILFFYF